MHTYIPQQASNTEREKDYVGQGGGWYMYDVYIAKGEMTDRGAHR